MQNVLEKAVLRGELREIDLHAALFMQKLAGKESPELLLATALLSRAVGEGHICLPIDKSAGKEVFSRDIPCKAPELDTWREHILASGVVGQDETTCPLLIDQDNRLYLSRHHRCECKIADDIISRSKGMVSVDAEEATLGISNLFPGSDGEDWQKVAVAATALKRFIVISGGPGTGKTYTVARILALQQMLAGETLRIGLVAPTGKAAVRMQESIVSARQTMDTDLAALVPVETKTLHRLLGFHPGTGTFRYNRKNKLHLDLLVIDEASMIDVELMAALVEALPEHTCIVMLGDRDQLTSVEAGSLFGDICSTSKPQWSTEMCRQVQNLAGWAPSPEVTEENFGDSVVLLRTSHRFQKSRGIEQLASIVNSGNADQLSTLREQQYDDLILRQPEAGEAQQWLEECLLAGFQQCFTCNSPLEALNTLSGFRVLCAIRHGSHGVDGMNDLAEKILRRHGLIHRGEQWYKGRPVIIRNNHYGLKLFNGDTGIVWPDDNGNLRAWFVGPEERVQQVPLSRLPEHDTAFAITVHQSQGSEFEEVLFMLPPSESRVLCRELIYTGITRARKKLLLFCDHNILVKAISERVVRYSGLGKKLWVRSDQGC